MASPTAEPPLPEEILEDIFLRIDEAADLARASAACISFRRLISAPRFLRRFRSLHRPPILGCLTSQYPEFQPIDPPRRSAAASAALAQAADFTFSFIKPRNNWIVCDVRDNRVLLAPLYDRPDPFEYLVICDPLHRRYATIPPIPGDLRPTSRERRLHPIEFEPFLHPASEEDDAEHWPLRVICNVLYESKVATLVFSSDTGKWQAAATFSYKYAPFMRHYVHNCFYWTHSARDDVLTLNPCGMKFSVIYLPPALHVGRDVAIVNAGKDRLGFVTLGFEKVCLELYTKSMRNNGVGGEGWVHDKTIPLPINCHWTMIGAREGYLVLHGFERGWFKMPKYSETGPERQYFIVELKTLLVERLCVFKPIRHHVYLYESFPPPLSLPSI